LPGCASSGGETRITLASRLIVVAYFIEVGLLLIVVPWSGFWERNYFLDAWPPLRTVVQNAFVRGAVSGIGVINLCAGLADLWALWPWRRDKACGDQGVSPGPCV